MSLGQHVVSYQYCQDFSNQVEGQFHSRGRSTQVSFGIGFLQWEKLRKMLDLKEKMRHFFRIFTHCDFTRLEAWSRIFGFRRKGQTSDFLSLLVRWAIWPAFISVDLQRPQRLLQQQSGKLVSFSPTEQKEWLHFIGGKKKHAENSFSSLILKLRFKTRNLITRAL